MASNKKSSILSQAQGCPAGSVLTKLLKILFSLCLVPRYRRAGGAEDIEGNDSVQEGVNVLADAGVTDPQ